MKRLDIVTAGIFVLFSIGCGLASATDFGNVWALGDSITWGVSSAGGYRAPLYTNLVARGHTFQFVGTRSDNASAVLTGAGQQWHDGWSGYAIADFSYVNNIGTPYNYNGLTDQVAPWYNSLAAKPDMTLLMIGINDLNQRYDEAGAPARLDALITTLYTLNPDMQIMVSTLPDADSNNAFRHNPPNNDLGAAIVDYNAAMAAIVSTRQGLGDKIALVDMHAGLTLADLSDGLHPNAVGYEKMANIWTDAMEAIPEPSTIGLFGAFGIVHLLVRSGTKKQRKAGRS